MDEPTDNYEISNNGKVMHTFASFYEAMGYYVEYKISNPSIHLTFIDKREIFLKKYSNLLAYFFEELSDYQANAVSNDFEFHIFVPDVVERRGWMKKFHELNGDPENYDEKNQYEIVNDSQIWYVIKHNFREPIFGSN